MTDSINLITAQITFLSTQLLLVHIPIEYYHFFLQPLLRVLFVEDNEEIRSIAWPDRHEFLNISITPVGCSLMCSKAMVDRYLMPLAKQLNSLIGDSKSRSKTSTIEISKDEYVVVQVDGQGLDASERVLELTGPLAMAGISIFFVTTYFSDYILVPARARHIVVTTLQQRGFVFSVEAEAYVSQLSPIVNHHNHSIFRDRPTTASSSGSEGHHSQSSSVPTTPPAKDIPELQVRTFTKLLQHKIEPIVDRSLRLVSCASSRETDTKFAQRLKDDLLQVFLASGQSPASKSPFEAADVEHINLDSAVDFSASYLSLTLSTEPVSILLEERLLPHFSSTLLASKSEEDILVPIILDLRSLGWQATGIVGGVAGRLSQGPASFQLEEPNTDQEPVEISFLSSAKAGSVIVQADQLEKALKALEMGMEEVKSKR